MREKERKMNRLNNYYIKTPLIKLFQSNKEKKLNSNIYFKLENLQPSGSFKDRGISHMIITEQQRNNKIKMLISSSGGNAGHSVATIGNQLNLLVSKFYFSLFSVFFA